MTLAVPLTPPYSCRKLVGAVGLSLSDIREAGAPIKGIENAASGVVPVMKLFEDSFSYANQLG